MLFRSGRTQTSLRRLSDDERRRELARIMGAGSSAETAVAYAGELIDEAEKFKKQR